MREIVEAGQQGVRRIKLMPDYGCFPWWRVAEDEIGDIDPAALPISAVLRDSLLRSAERCDTSPSWDDPGGPPTWNADEEQRVWEDWGELAWDLRSDLGPGFEVIRFAPGGCWIAGPHTLGREEIPYA